MQDYRPTHEHVRAALGSAAQVLSLLHDGLCRRLAWIIHSRQASDVSNAGEQGFPTGL